MDTNSFIESLEKEEDLTPENRLSMFMMLVDEDAIMKELKKHALLIKIGMAPNSPIYGLAYAVMRLSKPHLFEKEESESLSSAE